VVEFLVASSLILVVLVGASGALTASERSLARSLARDGAATIASNLLTQAALFRCQVLSDPVEAARTRDACAGLATLSVTPAAPGTATVAGDATFELRHPLNCLPGSSGCTRYLVEMTSRWEVIDRAGDAAVCYGADAPAPEVLERRVRLTWWVSGGTEPITAEYVSAQALPLSSIFTDATRGAVLVEAPAGHLVVLATSSGERTTRVAAPCLRDGEPSGEAWFPYLPGDGRYTVSTHPLPTAGDGAVTVDAALAAFALAASTTGAGTPVTVRAPGNGSGS